jgi:LmbE family N-acetylglucosaminyl deacetylase
MRDAKSTRYQAPVLVVAAHPDDEVLGCGGTISRMAGEGRSVHVLLMADGETSRTSRSRKKIPSHRLAVRNSAAEAACKILGCATVEMLSLPDNRLDGLELLDVVRRIETSVLRYQPLTVLTHHAGDVNIDHRVVHDAVIAACRPQPGHSVKELLFFEVPSSTEWRPPGSAEPFNPNWFVDISTTLDKKLEALKAYKSELKEFPHPRSLKAVEALALWRGATVGVDAAEAYILGRKIQPEKDSDFR